MTGLVGGSVSRCRRLLMSRCLLTRRCLLMGGCLLTRGCLLMSGCLLMRRRSLTRRCGTVFGDVAATYLRLRALAFLRQTNHGEP